MSSLLRPAVFLDRDGTLTEEVGYLGAVDLERLCLLPGAAQGVAELRKAGFAVVVTTNQSGVARGYYPESDLEIIHARLRELLSREGAAVDGIYYCPHYPDPTAVRVADLCRVCDCRKPAPGMARAAARDLGLDIRRSFVVGDQQSDIGVAESLGCGSVLVLTGYGEVTARKLAEQKRAPTYTARDLTEAARLIIAGSRR